MSDVSIINELAQGTNALIAALRARDDNTSAHSSRSCSLALELGRSCDLTTPELATLSLAAQLHDIGKIAIPDRVLLKPGRLDDDEMELMRSHPRRGHDILAAIWEEDVMPVAQVVLHHHENYDGLGYPDRLKGEDIPLLSRIVAIADSYDALATVRPYHKSRSHAEIMRIMFDGGKFDPWLRVKFAALVEHSPYKANSSMH
jgi:HD-GYP domain-containing protein (c-di-GMP phosphodiesterase class II)